MIKRLLMRIRDVKGLGLRLILLKEGKVGKRLVRLWIMLRIIMWMLGIGWNEVREMC